MGTAARRRREFLYLLLIATQEPEADALHLYQPAELSRLAAAK